MTLPEFFTPAVAQRLRSARGPAALVVANHVCAHIDDLAARIDAVRVMLRPGGAFIFEVRNDSEASAKGGGSDA